MSQAAHSQAEAFFELAQEMNQVDAWKQQMDQVAGVMNSVPELKSFFDAVKITNEEKKELLRQTMILSFDLTIKGLMEDGKLVDFDTVKARNYFLKNKNCF